MNREFKRRMKREERLQQRALARGRQPMPVPAQGQPGAKRERTGIRQYFKDIQAELKRVNWPTRAEVVTYSLVVIFVVTVITGFVFVLDLGFAQAILDLFRPQNR